MSSTPGGIGHYGEMLSAEARDGSEACWFARNATPLLLGQPPLWFALTQLAMVLVIIVTLCFFFT